MPSPISKFHIEQGPVLESEEPRLEVVDAIVGQTRMQFVFTGQANHAGTTPMHLRHDAMAAAAEWIVRGRTLRAVHARPRRDRGQSSTYPGAGNVIAGK
jgi:allantoate deiminase